MIILVLCINSHPILSVIAMSTETGRCNIISVKDISNPIVLKSFYLIKQPLIRIKFSLIGTVLGVATENNGKLFIVKGFEDLKLEVMTLVETSENVK